MNLKHSIFSILQRMVLVPVEPRPVTVRKMSCRAEDYEYRFGKHHLTATNPVHILCPDGYFRECRKHVNLWNYVENTTQEFFKEVVPKCFQNECECGGGIIVWLLARYKGRGILRSSPIWGIVETHSLR